jgi:two-component system CheB/CheR fusion protein
VTRDKKLKQKTAPLVTPTPEQFKRGFPIAGIGASAGGLEAFTRLLTHLPVDSGIAFVLVQHLAPNHESLSAEILSRVTKMPVTEVKDGEFAEPNHIYIIPPNFSMGILNGVLKLMPRIEDRGQHMVIDYFLKSLAEDLKNFAIGVVLSGTGSDGTEGLLAIKTEGGITLAQDPASAKFDGMPQSAIASGSVDLKLSPENIAKELARIAKHPYVSLAVPEKQIVAAGDQELLPSDNLAQIFLLLRTQCHVDFSFYKSNTVSRRIERRMLLHKMENLKAYSEFLVHHPDEVKALHADILIHVTGFFRDPEAFKALKTEAFPKLMQSHSPGAPVRVWVPGCSTGEEAYSIAISLSEFLGEKARHTPVQIFASDISEQAILKARLAEYPESISSSVTPERLSRYFIKLDGGGYKIAKSIRDTCLFSRHDVTTDPPFAKIDLISCRNLLIYFTSGLQKHVIPIFHYSLRPNGFLLLGKSETIGGSSEYFSIIDKINKIYGRRDAPVSLNLRFPQTSYIHIKNEIAQVPKSFKKVTLDVQKISEQLTEAAYPGVLINADMDILQFRGRTAPFIELASGVPSYKLYKMAHPELVRDLRAAILAADKQSNSVRKDGISIKDGQVHKIFNLNVIPTNHPDRPKEKLYLILFENIIESKSKGSVISKSKNRKALGKKDSYMLELQKELGDAQEYQHALVERFESSQEDLTAANEELQSSNEELQSTNEELETAKEELQSGNEELTTVNDELQTRSIEQAQTNNDLINLLGSVEIPIVMLGDNRRVRRFTPLAGKVLNLIPTDVGRPLSDLRLNFTAPSAELNLEQMVSTTIDTLVSQEIEVQDKKGHWFRLQVRPYKTVDNRIDGAVLALVDIDGLKQTLNDVKKARSEAEKANRAKDLFLATLSHELRTPLTAILSWAQMMRSGKLDADKIKRGAKVIEENSKTQAKLIDDLLDVSRIIAGKLSLETQEVDPTSIVTSAIEAVSHTAKEKSIQIETFFAPQIGSVMADPVRLQQVFWNLLTNAVKFSPSESKISVRVERVNDKESGKANVMVQVSDSGKGITPDFMPHIFDRFSQEDSSSVRVHGGLGLGLAIVRNLVELHGGTIRAESRGNNLGATFTVFLPIKNGQTLNGPNANHVNPPKSSNTIDGVPVNLDGVRVLLVDDEANTREALGELCRIVGAEVKMAGSSQEALNIFTQFKPHILVSDIAMPGEDGYSLIQKIRALGPAAGGNTPAIAMTAYASEDDVHEALSAGFQAHLSKPVDGHYLAKTIARLAEKSTE